MVYQLFVGYNQLSSTFFFFFILIRQFLVGISQFDSPSLFFNVSGNQYSSKYISVKIPVDRTVEKHIGKFIVDMAECQWIIFDSTVGKYQPVNFFGFFGIGEIIKEIGANQFITVNTCNRNFCMVYIRDYSIGINGYQRIKAGLN